MKLNGNFYDFCESLISMETFSRLLTEAVSNIPVIEQIQTKDTMEK